MLLIPSIITMKHFFLILFTFLLGCLCISSCSFFKKNGSESAEKSYSDKRKHMEADAQIRLSKARKYLAQGKCQEAKKELETMRDSCPLAIDARYKAILLMDSVDLQQARLDLEKADVQMQQKNGLSSKENFDEACRKVQFYERKLQYDTKSNLVPTSSANAKH